MINGGSRETVSPGGVSKAVQVTHSKPPPAPAVVTLDPGGWF